MNFKNRLRNKAFLVALFSAVLLLIQQTGLFEVPQNVEEIFNSILLILTILGIVNNPDTDNAEDNKIFDSKRNEIVKAITQAILSQLNIKYIDKKVIVKEVDKNTNVKTLYKVQVGAFGIRQNADNLVLELEKLGYKPFIDIE